MNRTYIVLALCISTLLNGRHPFRQPNPSFPRLTASYCGNSELFQIQSPYTRTYPLFAFHTDQLTPYLLHNEAICYKNDPARVVDGKTLSMIIEEMVTELRHKKKKIKKAKQLSDFLVIQDKNFNYGQSCGLIVLKFKKYPFILKLFMEKPSTFFNYRATGMEPTFFFYMGGGANRHLSGFTRLKNREILIDKVARLDRWKKFVDFPRKWFWLPRVNKEIELTGYNIGGHQIITTRIPSVYAIIADEIDIHNQITQFSCYERGNMIMQLCNDLELYVDPHDKNYAFIANEKTGFTIMLIDTEHFPTMVGLMDKKIFKNHTQWYTFLAHKCFGDMYLTSKKTLLCNQNAISKLSIM